jgi:hypothetical protein
MTIAKTSLIEKGIAMAACNHQLADDANLPLRPRQ